MGKRHITFAIIGFLLLTAITVVIYIASRDGVSQSVPLSGKSAAEPAAPGRAPAETAAPISATAAALGTETAVQDLWIRPPPHVAARNSRRCRLTGSLRPWGATDDMIRAMADGNIGDVVSKLKREAQNGDAAAGNQLFYMSRITCGFAGTNGAGSVANASQVLDSQALSAADGDWIRSEIEDENEFKQDMLAVCQQEIDTNAAKTWVTAAAGQGDAASHYLLAMYGNNHSSASRQAHLLEAVAAGYSRAQYALANLATAGLLVPTSAASSNVNAEELLSAAAADLPQAEARLAKCEFTGCQDIAIDIPAAVTHAREAAQRGAFETLLEIEPQLQASEIDPDEVEAWTLINAALELQGEVGGVMNIAMMKSASRVLDSPSITSHARTLADQYWRQYQGQILSNLGCAT
jgi:TPR repeat protein